MNSCICHDDEHLDLSMTLGISDITKSVHRSNDEGLPSEVEATGSDRSTLLMLKLGADMAIHQAVNTPSEDPD